MVFEKNYFNFRKGYGRLRKVFFLIIWNWLPFSLTAFSCSLLLEELLLEEDSLEDDFEFELCDLLLEELLLLLPVLWLELVGTGLVGVALRLLGFFLSLSFDEFFELEDLFDELFDKEAELIDGCFSAASLTLFRISLELLLDGSFFLIGSPNKFLKVSTVLTGFFRLLAFSFVVSEFAEDLDAVGAVVVLSL